LSSSAACVYRQIQRLKPESKKDFAGVRRVMRAHGVPRSVIVNVITDMSVAVFESKIHAPSPMCDARIVRFAHRRLKQQWLLTPHRPLIAVFMGVRTFRMSSHQGGWRSRGSLL
jgi:hypothetical protein